jgi:hypothetical protein
MHYCGSKPDFLAFPASGTNLCAPSIVYSAHERWSTVGGVTVSEILHLAQSPLLKRRFEV